MEAQSDGGRWRLRGSIPCVPFQLHPGLMLLRTLIQECSTLSLIHLVRTIQHPFSPELITVSRERRAQAEKEEDQPEALESRSGLLSLKPGIVAGKHEGKR